MKKHCHSISPTVHTGGSRKLRENRERTTGGFMKKRKERGLGRFSNFLRLTVTWWQSELDLLYTLYEAAECTKIGEQMKNPA